MVAFAFALRQESLPTTPASALASASEWNDLEDGSTDTKAGALSGKLSKTKGVRGAVARALRAVVSEAPF